MIVRRPAEGVRVAAPRNLAKPSPSTRIHDRVPGVELALATRQLAVLLQAGAPIHQALETLHRSTQHRQLSLILDEMSTSLSRGLALSQCLRRYPSLFSGTYLAMVRVGEETGNLARSFQCLGDWLERDEAVRRQVKSALVYPSVVISVAVLLGVLFFALILPGFKETLSGMPLPWLTRLLFLSSDLVCSPLSWVGLLVVGLLAWVSLRRRKLSPTLKRRVWTVLLGSYAIGPLLRNASVARFSACMEALLTTGSDVIGALSLAAQTSGNPLIEEEIAQVTHSLSQGMALADHFDDKPLIFPSVMVGMIKVGEEAAMLPTMFRSLGDFLERDVEYRVVLLVALLEPFLMATISTSVAVLILGIAMPLYTFLQSAL